MMTGISCVITDRDTHRSLLHMRRSLLHMPWSVLDTRRSLLHMRRSLLTLWETGLDDARRELHEIGIHIGLFCICAGLF